MKASIIAIGDELLIGQVQDSNSSWLASEFSKMGVKVQSISIIADYGPLLVQEIEESKRESNIIILTGGLGPTKDDVTKETLRDYFNVDYVQDVPTLERITSWFEKRGMDLIEQNIEQSMVPANCEVLPNHIGTAPGMWFTDGETIIVSVPGVPYEMKALFTQSVAPKILQLNSIDEVIEHKTLVVSGIPESLLSKELENFEAELPDDMQLSYLPNFQAIRLRLTDYKAIKPSRIEPAFEMLKAEVADYIIAEADQQIEEIVGQLLLSEKSTVSFAESCTGGNIAHKMTSVPGSSMYFEGGIVAYSYDVKEGSLGISQEILQKYGAVSQEVVEAMAKSIRVKMNTDYSLAVSGIAGPGGGMPNKPVGTVWIAVSSKETCKSQLFHFRGDRQKVIQHTTANALEFLRRLIVGSY